MDGVDEFNPAKIELMAAAMIQWMALGQALFAEPDRQFEVGDNCCAGAFSDYSGISHVIRMPVGDEDEICFYFVRINIAGQFVTRDEWIKQ